MTIGPLIIDYDSVEHGIDGKERIAVRDQTPSRNLVGFMLAGDADRYIELRNANVSNAPVVE